VARVLLVNDDIAEISAVKRVLARAGHQPMLATNAQDALTAIQQAAPDLLVVGATCEGGDALQRIAAAEAARAIRLVVLGEGDGAPPGAATVARPIDPGLLADEVSASLAAGPPRGATERDEPAAAQPAPGPAAANGSRAKPDPAGARKAAAEALRARAEELRRGTQPGGVPAHGAARSGAAAAATVRPAADGTPFPVAPDAAVAPTAVAADGAVPAEPGAPGPRPAAAAPPEPPGVPEAGGRAGAGAGQPPPAAPPVDLDDSGLEAILRRAEEAERAHAAERKARERQADRATVEAAHRAEAERIAVEKASRARAAEERARAGERGRAEAEARAAAEGAARARAEEDRRAADEERRAAEVAERARAEEEARLAAEATARAEAEARRAAHAVERARAEEEARLAAEATARAEAEARRRAEAERQSAQAQQRAEARARADAEEEARRAAGAEERARVEAAARLRLEEELEQLRNQVVLERRSAEERIHSVMERAAAEERASEDLRRLAEEEAQRRAEEEGRRRESEEEQLRAAIASARAEMDALRKRSDEEARKRAEAEAEAARLAREVERRAGEAEAETARIAREVERRAAEAEAETAREAERRAADAEAEKARRAREADRRAAEAAAQPAPFDLPVYRPPDEDPLPDPGEEAARRRVAALRGEPEPSPAAGRDRAPEPPPAGAKGAPPAAASARSAAPGSSAASPPSAASASPTARPPPAGTPAPERTLRMPPSELRAGTLADLPAPRLLALAARGAISGRLDVEGEVARSIWLDGGRIVGASSADPSERVEELALRIGLVTREQHRQVAGSASTLSTRRAALILLERGYLKPTELTPLVRRRTEEVVFGAFAEVGARFRWAAEEVPSEERTSLDRDTLALAVEGVRRRWLAPQVDAVLGGPGTLLAPVGSGPSLQDLALSAEERRAVSLADGLRTLDEILGASPLDALSTRQVLAALVLVGSLAVRTFQGGKPAAAATTAIDLARVHDKLDQVRRADYFTILGVSRLCTPHEVRQAAERLFAEFEPARYQGIHEDGLPGRLDEILHVVGDAKEILVDDRLRSEYLRGLGDAEGVRGR
jgi:Domain of unknown function (DUF4388)